MTNRYIVKIGTESLDNFHSSPKVSTMIEGIVDRTRDRSMDIVLVTSGSVQFGRNHLTQEKSDQENKPLLAAVGWDILLSEYRKKFGEYGKKVAGFLVTHADIEDYPSRRDALKKTIFSAWDRGILPIINENDALSVEELDALNRGGDNDQNAFLLAKMLDSRHIIFTTNTNGVYANPDDPNSRISAMKSHILTVEYIHELCGKKSTHGTGGMTSKLQVAHEAGKFGISTHIGNGINSGIHDFYTAGTNIWAYNPEVQL